MSFVKIIFLLLTLLKIISGSEVFKIVNKGEKMCRKQMAVNKLTATKVFPTTNIIYTIECENVTFCPSNCKWTTYECSDATFDRGSNLRGIRVNVAKKNDPRMELYCCKSDATTKDCEDERQGSSLNYTIYSQNKNKFVHYIRNNNGRVQVTVRMCLFKVNNESQVCPAGPGDASAKNPPPVLPPVLPGPIPIPSIPKSGPRCIPGVPAIGVCNTANTCKDSGTLQVAHDKTNCEKLCLADPTCLAYNFKGADCVFFKKSTCTTGYNNGGIYCPIIRPPCLAAAKTYRKN